uniref:Uncharacterized protein n=1 Tax=Human betaherpesvirus 6 TaxID=10368 RepID=A0A1W6G188_9BETA|nr:hypothetical protein [Human betaherpesvirus 6]
MHSNLMLISAAMAVGTTKGTVSSQSPSFNSFSSECVDKGGINVKVSPFSQGKGPVFFMAYCWPVIGFLKIS